MSSFGAVRTRVETLLTSISRQFTGRKRERPAQPADAAAPEPASEVVAPEGPPPPPARTSIGSPGSAFEPVTEDWVAARAAAAHSSESEDAAEAVHAAKRQRAISMNSAQERLQQAELQAREMRRKVPLRP